MISGGLNGMEMQFAGTAVMLVGALVMLYAGFFLVAAIAPIIVMLGFLVFAAGFAMATANYTQQNWVNFGCVFIAIFGGMLGYNPYGLIPTILARFFQTMQMIYILDNTAGFDALPCSDQL